MVFTALLIIFTLTSLSAIVVYQSVVNIASVLVNPGSISPDLLQKIKLLLFVLLTAFTLTLLLILFLLSKRKTALKSYFSLVRARPFL